jgi:hypothetical protein
MNRTTAFSLAVLGIAAGALPLTARAADEETQVWLTGTMVTPLAEDVTGTFELSRRIREGDDQVLLRGNADWKLSEAVSLGGGAAYVNSIDGLLETGEDKEFRPHQQLTLSFGVFAFRTRVEQRFFEEADRMGLRIRQRVQASTTVAKDTRAAVSGELFYIARSEDEGGDDGQIAQWRLNATLAHRPSRHLEVTLGYLMMYTPRTGEPDKIAHVPQLTLTYRR